MCGSLLDINKIVLDPFGTAGVNKRPIQRGFQTRAEPTAVRPPPGIEVNTELAAQAAKAKQLDLAAAFGLNDTKLTGGTGLGSVPKGLLLTPTFGGY